MEKGDVMIFEKPMRVRNSTDHWRRVWMVVWMVVTEAGPLLLVGLFCFAEVRILCGVNMFEGEGSDFDGTLALVASVALFLLVLFGLSKLEEYAHESLRIDDEGVTLKRFHIARKAVWSNVTLLRVKPGGRQDNCHLLAVLYRASGIWRYLGHRPFPLMLCLDKEQSDTLLMEVDKRRAANPGKYAFEIVQEPALQNSSHPAPPLPLLMLAWFFLIQGIGALVAGGVLLSRDASAGISGIWAEGIQARFTAFGNGHDCGWFLLFVGTLLAAIGGVCRWRFGVIKRRAVEAQAVKRPGGNSTLSS